MATLDEAAEKALDTFEVADMFCGDYEGYKMIDMFKAGAEYMKQQILQLLDDRMTSNLANEGNSAGGRLYTAKMEEDIDIITEVKKL